MTKDFCESYHIIYTHLFLVLFLQLIHSKEKVYLKLEIFFFGFEIFNSLDNESEKTISVWSFIFANKNYFKNPLYENDCRHILQPSWKMKDLKVWEEYFGRWREKGGCVDEKFLEVSERSKKKKKNFE